MLHGLARPREGHEFRLGIIAVAGITDDPDKFVQIGQGYEIAFELLGLDLGLPQEKASPAQHNLAPMLDVTGNGVLERKKLRLPAINGQHVDAERGFERGEFIEIVDENLRIPVALEFDNYAGVFVGFVANVADARRTFSLTSSAIRLTSSARLTPKGISVTIIFLTSTLDFFRPTRGSHPHEPRPVSK